MMLRRKHRQNGQKVWMTRVPSGPLTDFFLSIKTAVLTAVWAGIFQLALTWAMRAVRRFLAATLVFSFSSLGLLFFQLLKRIRSRTASSRVTRSPTPPLSIEGLEI